MIALTSDPVTWPVAFMVVGISLASALMVWAMTRR